MSHSKSPWEDFQESLRTMVVGEASSLLNDPQIRNPDDKSNSFANTLWLAMSADNNNTTDDEAGKASFSNDQE